MDALIAAGIIGIIGGIIGSLFIRVNNRVNLIRKKLLGTYKGRKIIECLVLVIITTTSFFSQLTLETVLPRMILTL
jgi:H+/Cl- antiporter ClcA